MNQLFVLSFFLISSFNVWGATDLNEGILNEYLKLQKEFFAESCVPGTEDNFQSLDKNYRGDGNFIPVLLDEKIDLKTIKNALPVLSEKDAWINDQIAFLKKSEGFSSIRQLLDQIEKTANQLQNAKKDFSFSDNDAQKDEIKKNAARLFDQLRSDIEQLKKDAPFLLSFRFPLNHLSMRAEYDKFKAVATKEGRARANSVYFLRKIVQDGSFDSELIKNDAIIRSGFDTLYLSLTKEKTRDFLTEIERVDLKFVLSNFHKLLSGRPEIMLERFLEWKGRNLRSMSFYQDLVEGKKIKISENSQIKDVTTLLEERARSLYTLKDFVLNKEARAYDYWSTKSELMQSLYVIETILYSEVGRIDGPDALERRDVAQVVINRSQNNTFNILSDKDALFKYLSPKIKVQENKWLNVLFKEGEFSFTYFYIPGNLHIYCPDMTKVGQFLRRENVRIALELLNRPRNDFAALRYFSRVSMFGRIEMDGLWENFTPIPETPGRPVKNSKKVSEIFKKYGTKFLYFFKNAEVNKTFLVVESKGKTYVIDSANSKQIYNYRNPNQFKYFSLLK